MEHKFNVEIACKYGIEEAIMIDNIYFWIKKNLANDKHHYEGRYWTYNTANAFNALFPYITPSKIYRILTKLEQDGILIKSKFNSEKYIQMNWFAFTDEALIMLNDQKYDVTGFADHFSNLQNGFFKNENCYNNTISYNTKKDNKKEIKKEIEESISKKDDDLFEKCWLAYRRKGSKKKSKEYWHKLSDEEKERVLPHINAYVSSRDLSYQKDFERYLRDKIFLTIVFNKNQVMFDPTQDKQKGYHPELSPLLMWNDYYNCYMYIGGYFDGHISDGYDDNNRPEGATITLNNGRGTITWDSTSKQWVKKLL